MNASTQMFLLALATLAGGVALTMNGQTEAGMLLLGAAVGTITSGGIAKRKEGSPPTLPVFLLCLAGLSASCTPGKAYVQADLATYDVIAPAHQAYLEADTNLTEDQRNRRLRTLKTWELRIRKAEGEDK